MKYQIRGKNIQVTSAIKEYVGKRLGKLDKYFEASPEAVVTLIVTRERQRIEVTIPIEGYILRGEEETTDMYTSIDLVMEKLERQIEKYKTRLIKKVKSAGVKDIAFVPLEKPVVDNAPILVRTKRFSIKPMNIDEAIMQMNLLGHSFFVFSNSETDEVNVVYCRKDGNYGLIDPKV